MTKPLLAILLLLPLCVQAEERFNIKGIYLGMPIIELREVLKPVGVLCDLRELDSYADCFVPHEVESMTIAGQDCKIIELRGFNDGKRQWSSRDFEVYKVAWTCTWSGWSTIKRAFETKFNVFKKNPEASMQDWEISWKNGGENLKISRIVGVGVKIELINTLMAAAVTKIQRQREVDDI